MKNLIFSLLVIVSSLSANKIYATFDVEASKSASVAFSSSGIIDKVFVDIGSVVKQGDKLAVLDNKDTRAVLNIHKTTLKFAKKDFERQKKIRKIIDQAKFDSYVNKYESAKAQVAYQKTLLDKTILKAPFDGIVISKEIESGDVVSGQMIRTAFKIQSKIKRKLVLQFDQKYHTIVKVGDKFKYKLDGDTTTYTGTIAKVYPYADTKTRKIKAEVLTQSFIVGLFGDGYITTSK
ncbi:MAG: efflux RND transporter periplasmic adaptor subunit [Campylobacterota bacterium]|nr:efflux RND transporter periplasmic adaptor subunit [Campylobacterota bacterium]